MSSQLQYLLIGACILGFTAMEFITRRYQAAVRGNATANDTWLEVLMFVSLIAITQPIALLGTNALAMAGFPKMKEETITLLSNRHLALERYQGQVLQRAATGNTGLDLVKALGNTMSAPLSQPRSLAPI